MATENQFAYNIRNIARAGQGNSDDDRLTIKQVKFWLQGHRAEGVYEFTSAGKRIDPQLVQDLGVLKLTEIDSADSECPDVEWGCKIKKVDLPKFVDFPDNRAIAFVGKIDKITPIILNHPDVIKFKAETRFGKITSRATMIGNRLYLYLVEDDMEMEYINVRGVFEDPAAVEFFPKEGCDAVCYNPAVDQYPMPMRLYEYVLRQILTLELNWTIQSVNDELNNARQDNEKLG